MFFCFVFTYLSTSGGLIMFIGFLIITRSLTMDIERNLVRMIRTGPPEVSKPSRDLILRD